MKAAVKRTILKILKDTYDKIENDTCGLDDEEIIAIAKNLTHVRLNIEETCKHLNCSRPTLNRMIADGRIPKPYKKLGGEKYWYQDELDDFINQH